MSSNRRQSETEDVCLICCEPLLFVAVGLSCKHDVCCALCSLRMRLLLKDENCVYCKTESPRILITRHGSNHIEDFESWGDTAGPGYKFVDNAGAFFDLNVIGGEENMEKLLGLNTLSCDECASKPVQVPKAGPEGNAQRRPRPNKKNTFPNFAAYQQHMVSKHGKHMCSICAEFRGQFVKELETFTKAGLAEHNKKGDPKTAFRGHPSCKFCKTLYYNEDHLYKHLHEKHENCHICARDPKRRHEYYRDYRNLEKHFKKDHYLCTEKECLENKFVVFSTDIDLQAHILSHHPHLAASTRSRNMLPVNFTIRRAGERQGESAVVDPESIDSFAFSYNPRQQQQELLDIHRENRQQRLNMGEASFPSLGPASGDATAALTGGARANYGSAIAAQVAMSDERAFPALPSSKPMGKNARRRANRRTAQQSAGATPVARGIQIQVKTKQGNKKRGKGEAAPAVAPVPARETAPASVAEVQPRLERVKVSEPVPTPSPKQMSAMAEITQVIKACLHGDESKFGEFQLACARYATKELNAEAYYTTISQMFAKNQLNLFLPALIGTLPTEELAQGLKNVHEAAMSPTAKQTKPKKSSPQGATSARVSAPAAPPAQRSVRAAQTAQQSAPVIPSTQQPARVVPGAQLARAAQSTQQQRSVTPPQAPEWPGLSSQSAAVETNERLRWRSDMAPWAKSSKQKAKPVAPKAPAVPNGSSAEDFPSLATNRPKGPPVNRTLGSAQKRWDEWQKSSGGSKTFVLKKKKTKKF